MSNKIITLENLQTNNAEMKKWVNGVIAGKVDYLGTVSAESELDALREKASPGDYCRAAAQFDFLNPANNVGTSDDTVHIGDLIVFNADSPNYWDVIHTEDPVSILGSDHTWTGSNTFTGTFNVQNRGHSLSIGIGPDGDTCIDEAIYISKDGINSYAYGNSMFYKWPDIGDREEDTIATQEWVETEVQSLKTEKNFWTGFNDFGFNFHIGGGNFHYEGTPYGAYFNEDGLQFVSNTYAGDVPGKDAHWIPSIKLWTMGPPDYTEYKSDRIIYNIYNQNQLTDDDPHSFYSELMFPQDESGTLATKEWVKVNAIGSSTIDQEFFNSLY